MLGGMKPYGLFMEQQTNSSRWVDQRGSIHGVVITRLRIECSFSSDHSGSSGKMEGLGRGNAR